MSFEMEENLEASVNAVIVSPLATQIYPQLLMHTTNLLGQAQVAPAGGVSGKSMMSQDFDLFAQPHSTPKAYKIMYGNDDFQWRHSYRFKAAYLKMEQFTAANCGTVVGTPTTQPFDIPASKVFELTPPADPTQHYLMITGQLTGCTICWRRSRRNPENLFIAHLQPEKAAKGEELQQDIRSYGTIRGARAEVVFGRQQYGTNPRCCNFFGVWDPAEPKLHAPGFGRWRFYAQMQSATQDYSLDTVMELKYQ